MPTFANTINGNEILAKRSQCDYAGNDLQTTYATKTEVTTGLASKEDSANKSQTLDPTSTTEFPSSAATASFVNSSVATATANFLGNFTLADLGLTYPATDTQIGAALDSYAWPAGVTPTNNDYTYIEIENPQTTIDNRVERFKYNGSAWVYEYTLNNSSFTAAEKAAIDSGIDSAKVAIYDAHVANSDIHVTLSDKSTWNAKQDAINDLSTIRSGAQAGSTAVQPGDLATVATTGAYSDLSGTPTIPSVDQTFDASSSNAQSGVAVAQAIATKEDAFDVGTGLEMDTSGATPTLQVEAPVDIVAGPGIVIDNPDGNTLRVSSDENYEVELYKNIGVPNSNIDDVYTLSESVTNFERIRVEFWNREFNQFRVTLEYYITDSTTSTEFVASMDNSTSTSDIQRLNMVFSYNSAGNIVDKGHVLFYGNGSSYTNGNTRGLGIHRVVGIHRIANN